MEISGRVRGTVLCPLNIDAKKEKERKRIKFKETSSSHEVQKLRKYYPQLTKAHILSLGIFFDRRK